LNRAEYEGTDYGHWFVDHVYVLAPAGFYVGQWLQSFRDFPPRQKPGSFNLDRVMESIISAGPKNSN
jgi:arylsulfatase